MQGNRVEAVLLDGAARKEAAPGETTNSKYFTLQEAVIRRLLESSLACDTPSAIYRNLAVLATLVGPVLCSVPVLEICIPYPIYCAINPASCFNMIS